MMRFSYLAGLILPALLMGTGPANATAVVTCTVPGYVHCAVSSPNGIKDVKVRLKGPNGWIYVVHNIYPECPKQVNVSWDPINPTGEVIPTECSSGLGRLKTTGRGKREAGVVPLILLYEFKTDAAKRTIRIWKRKRRLNSKFLR